MSNITKLIELIRETHPSLAPMVGEEMESACGKIARVIQDLRSRRGTSATSELPHGSPMRDLRGCGCAICLVALQNLFAKPFSAIQTIDHDGAWSVCPVGGSCPCGLPKLATAAPYGGAATTAAGKLALVTELMSDKDPETGESREPLITKERGLDLLNGTSAAEACICFGSRSRHCRAEH